MNSTKFQLTAGLSKAKSKLAKLAIEVAIARMDYYDAIDSNNDEEETKAEAKFNRMLKLFETEQDVASEEDFDEYYDVVDALGLDEDDDEDEEDFEGDEEDDIDAPLKDTGVELPSQK